MVVTSHIFCAAWPKSKAAGQKIPQPEIMEAFFHLELQLQTTAGRVSLGGWRRKKKNKHHQLLSLGLAFLQGLLELRLIRIYSILETVSTFS